MVLDVHESGRYEVLLEAIKSKIGSKIEFCAVHLLVHCKNWRIVSGKIIRPPLVGQLGEGA